MACYCISPFPDLSSRFAAYWREARAANGRRPRGAVCRDAGRAGVEPAVALLHRNWLVSVTVDFLDSLSLIWFTVDVLVTVHFLVTYLFSGLLL